MFSKQLSVVDVVDKFEFPLTMLTACSRNARMQQLTGAGSRLSPFMHMDQNLSLGRISY